MPIFWLDGEASNQHGVCHDQGRSIPLSTADLRQCPNRNAFSSWDRTGLASRRSHGALASAWAFRSCILTRSTGTRAGCQPRSGEFRERMAEAAGCDTWVMEGNYTSHLDLRLPRAEAVIWLDLPRHVDFPRAIWRSIRNYGRERDDVGRGNPEQFDLSFFRDWVWTYPARSRARHAQLLASLPSGIPGIILRSRREVTNFTNNLPCPSCRAAVSASWGSAPSLK